MTEFLILWLPWWIIATAFIYLIYVGVTADHEPAVVGWAAAALFVASVIWALNWPGLYESIHGDRLDQYFPEIFDTRPLRAWIDDGLTWVVRNWSWFFEGAAYPLLLLLLNIERALLAVPWWLIILVFSALAWLATRRIALSAVVVVGMLFLGLLDMWEDSVRTMALMLAATITAILTAIPVGVVMARSVWFRKAMTPLLDLMQTMPSFVYLIPTVMIFGPGKIPALIATIVYAAPPLVRLTDLGIRLVDPDVMEATRAFGTSPQQRLTGVQIPLAMPTILAGVNQTTMMALAMVVIASMIGAGGLGYQVLQGIGRLEVSRGLFAGLGIVVLAIIFDRITQAFGRRLQARIGLAETRT